VKRAVKERNLPAVILNPCHLVGAYDDQNWSQMITLVKHNKLPGIPPGIGSFCDIEEVAKAHISAVDQGRVGENYILSGHDASFIEFVNEIGQLTGRKPGLRATPKTLIMGLGYLSYWVSLISQKEPNVTPEKAMIVSERLLVRSAKAQRELGYKADVPLVTQLAKCVQWMAEVGRL
jgi:nucleoside-diphosphate-sugar epimerase